MINTASNSIKEKHAAGGLADKFHLLPEWEIIKDFMLSENKFLFFKKDLKAELLKKFSEKTGLEKYIIRAAGGKTLSSMDLRVYKDSVYIVNLEFQTSEAAASCIEQLIKTALNSAGREKSVIMNIMSGQKHKFTLKKELVLQGFSASETQSAYEQKMFGEAYMRPALI